MATNDMFQLPESTGDLFSGTGGYGGGFGGPSQLPNLDPGMSSVTTGDVFGTGLPTNYDPVTGQTGQPSQWDNLYGSIFGSGAPGTTPATTPQPAQGGGVGSWLSNLWGGNPANGGASGLGPYLAAGAGGLAMAKQAQNQATSEANELKALGKPFTTAGQQLLSQFQSGKLRPDQQAVVDTTSKFSSDLTKAASPLGQIAQQAFSDYNSGKLPPADELKLQQQIQAQKQQMRQMMATSGITDSSVLAEQDQNIDNQAMIARQNLLDQRFQTGNQAYDQWLKTTSEGQQLKLQGQEFASTSFEQMLNDSLGLASEGMQPAMQAIQLKIQSDAELSQTVSELLGNLASAYSYAAAGPKTVVNAGGGGGGQGGGGPSQMSQIISGIGGLASTASTVGKMFGFSGASGQAAGLFGTALGGAAAGAGVYNFVDNWQSGDTGGDALRGAEAGAAIGSVVPVVGTAFGALAGGAIGALSSAFGSGKKDPESSTWNGYATAFNQNPASVQNAPPDARFLALAGLFDSRSGQITGKVPFYNKYGRMGENKFTQDMTGMINQALAKGKISKTDDAATIYSKIVAPWINSMGEWNDPNKGAQQSILLGMVNDYITGQYKDWKAIGGDYNFGNSIQPFGTQPSAPAKGKKTIPSFMGRAA